MIRGGWPRQQFFKGRDEIIGNRAADAAIRKLDNIVLGAGFRAAPFQDFAINPEITKFVDNQRDPLALRVLQHMPDQRGFSGTKKPGDDGGGGFRGHCDLQ